MFVGENILLFLNKSPSMKKTQLFFTISSLAALFVSCGPTKNDAIKYNDQLIAIQKSLSPAYNTFINQIDGHNKDSLKLSYASFCSKAKSCLDECTALKAFGGSTEYRDAALDYFRTINTMADNEGKQIMDIALMDREKITDKEVDVMKTASSKFDTESARVLQKVGEAQVVFSTKWKFAIAKD